MNIRDAWSGLRSRVRRLLGAPGAHPAAPTLEYDETAEQGRPGLTNPHGTNTPPPPRRPWTPGT